MRRTDLENNCERYVAGRYDDIDLREKARYSYAEQHITGNKILDIGCSSGYGCKVMNIRAEIIDYVGVDYDQTIIDYAREQFGDVGRFYQFDVRSQEFLDFLETEKFDTIIAFEILEHIENGKEFAQMLKQHCTTLVCSTPYKEPVGFWGEHHVLHNLTENDFPGFVHKYMQPDGSITEQPQMSPFQLMVMTYSKTYSETYSESEKKSSENYEFRYTVIIPHVDKTEELLIPCLQSLSQSIDHDDKVQIIIVENGTPENEFSLINYACDVMQSVHANVLVQRIFYRDAMGYTFATNRGLERAAGEYVLLLNNDTKIFEYGFLRKLSQPFRDNDKVGVTGIKQHHLHYGLGRFIIGMCLMTKKSIIDEVGLLDEQFNPGGHEDGDFCLRVQQKGYEIQAIPLNMSHSYQSSTMPRFVENWQKTFDDNIIKLGQKYGKYNHVTAVICTRNRYDMLAQCLVSVLHQTEKINRLVIIDDSDEPQDIRNIPALNRLIKQAEHFGIDWFVLFGEKRGQHISHEIGQGYSEELVWRIDDDCIAMPDTVQKLKNIMFNYPEIGAVGGRVLTPDAQYVSSGMASGDIHHIRTHTNVQWYTDTPSGYVDHLHCTFMYRKGIAHFRNDLSKVAHREETIFTYDIRRAGYDVFFHGDVITYHLRAASGGIRDGVAEMFDHDEQLFLEYLKECNIIPLNRPRIVWLNNGLGDHYAFTNILPDMLKHYPDLIVAAAYPDALSDFENLKIISIGEAEQIMTERERQELDIYKFMWANNWENHIIDAYRQLYLRGKS